MNIINKFFNKMGYEKKQPASPGSETVNLLNENIYYSTGNNLLGYYKHWVYTCINKIAQQVSSYDFAMFTYKKQSQTQQGNKPEKTLIEGNPLIEVFNSPNPIQTRQALIQHAVIRFELNGYFAFYLPRGVGNVPYQCWCLPLTDSGVLYPIVKDNTLSHFVYQDGTVSMTISPEEIIYVNYPHPRNPFYGMSPILAQTYPYDIDDFLDKHIYSVFKNGATFGNHFTTEQNLKKQQIDDLKTLISEQYQGALNAGKPIVTHSGLKLDNTPLRSPMESLMIKDITEYSRDKIITAYNLTPGKLGLVTDINRATMEVLDSMFIKECIKPKTSFIQGYVQKYVSDNFDPALIFEILVQDVIDKEFRLKEKQTNLSMAYSSINQERAKDGEEPVPWGEVPLVPFNLAPLNTEQVVTLPLPEEKSLDKYKSRPNKRVWKFKPQSDMLKKGLQLAWKKAMQQYFNEQYKEISKKLNNHGKGISTTLTGWGINKKSKWIKDNIKQFDDMNINLDKEAEKLVEIARGLFYYCFTEYGNAKLKLFGIREPYEVHNPKAESWLGSRLRTFSKEITGVTFDEIQNILREGFKEGQSVYEIGTTLREKFESWDKYRAMNIAQTETNSACSFSELDALQQNGLDKKLMKFWINEYNARDTHIQAGKDYNENNAIAMDEEFNIGADTMQAPGMGTLPEENINCFPGDMICFSPDYQYLFRNRFKGDIITIKFSNGNKFSGTPNHPILTDRGFIALKLLKQGDNIISTSPGEWSSFCNFNIDNKPMFFEQKFNSFYHSRLSMRIGGADVDFYGDIPDSDVDVINVNRKLLNRADPSFLQPIEHNIFTESNVSSVNLTTFSSIYRVLSSNFSGKISKSDISFLSNFPFLFERHIFKSENIGFTYSSFLNSISEKSKVDNASGNFIFRGKSKNGHTGIEVLDDFITVKKSELFPVQPKSVSSSFNSTSALSVNLAKLRNLFSLQIVTSKVTDIHIESFQGNVYTMSTNNQIYICNGVIVKNCRCSLGYTEIL